MNKIAELVDDLDHLDESIELTLYHLQTMKREREEVLTQIEIEKNKQRINNTK